MAGGQTRRMKSVLSGFVLLLLILLIFSFSFAAAEVNPEPYDRVIIFGVDGAGTMIQEGDTPNFDRIFSDGIITYNAYAPVPTVSAPGWGSVFYGVPGIVHGAANNIAERFHKTNDLYTSIFKLAKETYPEAEVASFSTWSAINWGMIERDCGIYLYPDIQKESTEEEIVQQAVDYLENNNPELLFVYFGDLDTALHHYGYGSPKYFKQMTKTDEQIGLVYDELVRRGLLENTLIIFITDHGGNGVSHGGGSDKETRITFAVAGPRIEAPGTIIEDMEIQDVAAIVLYALGIEQPEYQTGRVPKGIFPGVGGGKRRKSDMQERMVHYGKGIANQDDTELNLPPALADKLVYYQGFDGKIKGLSGKKELSPGLAGNGLNMRNSFLKTGIKHSAKWPGMTIGFWFKDEGKDPGDAVFVADKSWRLGHYKGFMISMNIDELQVNVGGGKKYRGDLLWNLPPDYEGKWIHCLVVFDQSTQMVSLYFNFECVAKAKLLPAKHSTWVTGKGIIAGQDTTGKYRYWMKADMDDLMIFNQPLTAEEVEEIRNSYEVFFTE